MELKLTNTLTGTKEVFTPREPNRVSMYNCGPTVYDYAHIGNLRAFLMADTLRRTLTWAGFTVRQVMNITDVGHLTSDADEGEDKMTKALKREGKPLTREAMREVSDFYTAAFLANLDELNMIKPDELPRASDHIQEDIEMIATLFDRGFAYKTTDGIYFDTSKYPQYGKLGNIHLEGLEAGARVASNPEKRTHTDFALWKYNSIGWESPWGNGFPGWHIECSAMSKKYVGDVFDIHTGGIDHIPVHHNNEIAQSEAVSDTVFPRTSSFARYWIHNAHLTVRGEKMAKSTGGFITLQTIKDKGFHPLTFRYFLLGAHYSTTLSFSFEALEQARLAHYKLLHALASLGTAEETPLASYLAPCEEAILDDMNTSLVLAFVWNTLKDPALTAGQKRGLIFKADECLGLDLKRQSAIFGEKMRDIPEDVRTLLAKREEARSAKAWEEADKIRALLEERGFIVEDTPQGPLPLRKI